jgi:hypothetical protein
MKSIALPVLVSLALALPAFAAPQKQSSADDIRKSCRDQIAKSGGNGAKVSNKQVDACVSRGGKF